MSIRWRPNSPACGCTSCSRTADWRTPPAFQGKDAILSGPAGGIVGAARTAAMAGLDQHHRLRHGRHVDRRRTLRRRLRARLRDRGRRRAHARADDGDQHGGGGRRLHPAFRWHAVPRRTGFRRRRSGPGLLPPRRAADGDRCQCLRRQDPAAALPGDLRARWRSAARCRCRDGRNSPHWPRRSRRPPASRARRARWRRGSCRSPSPTWRMRSSRSRCRRATTPRASRCNASAAPAVSTPAWSPMRSAWRPCSSIRLPACCRPMAWVLLTRR